MPEQERIDVPEPVTLVGVRVQASPVIGLMLDAMFTIALKPVREVTVIVEVPATPALIVTVDGLAEIVKSWTRYVMVVDATFAPLEPFTVTVYCPGEPEQESVEFPDAVNVVTLRLQVRPVLGETVSFRVTVPKKVGAYVTVIVDSPVDPVMTETVEGLAVMVKAVPTVYFTNTECDRLLPVPVTVTLKVPDGRVVEHDRIEDRDVVVVLNAKLAGLSTHVRPVDGEMESVRATFPVKP